MKTLSQHIINLIEMNKSKIAFFTLAIIAFHFVSCTAQEDNENKTVIKSEKYEPCCGNLAEVNREIIPGISIFVPNVFTPNGDGINDYFYPVVDTSLVPNGSVLYFSIYDSEDDKVKKGIFNREWVNYNDIRNYAFDGGYLDSESLKWKKWEGQFWYQVNVIIEGKGEFKIKGSACSVICDDEAAIFQDKQGCFFPIQVTKDIKGDNKLSNQETDCFK